MEADKPQQGDDCPKCSGVLNWRRVGQDEHGYSIHTIGCPGCGWNEDTNDE